LGGELGLLGPDQVVPVDFETRMMRKMMQKSVLLLRAIPKRRLASAPYFHR
jgi:hypothetical protein